MNEEIDLNQEKLDLNFSCEPGDLIQVRSRAIMCGEQDFSVSSWRKDGWNVLGSNDLFNWRYVDNDRFTLCLVTAKHVFPDEAWNLNYLELLISDGRTGRVFDDPLSGFWIPFSQVEQRPKVKEASTRAWMKRKAQLRTAQSALRHPHARG